MKIKSNEENMKLNIYQTRALYRAVRRHFSFEEKLQLLDFRGNLENYEKRLLKLAKKYGIDIKKVLEDNKQD